MLPTQLMAKKPNILVMWGDDVGYGIQVLTTMVLWDIKLQISTASQMTVHCLQICMHSSHVRQVVHRSYWDNNLLEQVLLTIGMPGSDHGIQIGHRPLEIFLKNKDMQQVSLVKTT